MSTPAHQKRLLRQLEGERSEVHDAITNLYWTFTRTARGKPPCVVAPELYEQRSKLDLRIREIRRSLAAS